MQKQNQQCSIASYGIHLLVLEKLTITYECSSETYRTMVKVVFCSSLHAYFQNGPNV